MKALFSGTMRDSSVPGGTRVELQCGDNCLGRANKYCEQLGGDHAVGHLCYEVSYLKIFGVRFKIMK